MIFLFQSHCIKCEKYMVFSLVLSISADVLSGTHTLLFFFPGICVKATRYFHCSFGKRDETCDTHKNPETQKQTGFINKAHFWLKWPWLPLRLTEQPGTNALTACAKTVPSLRVSAPRIKHSIRPWWKVTRDFWRPTHAYFLPVLSVRTFLGRFLLVISWDFRNS